MKAKAIIVVGALLMNAAGCESEPKTGGDVGASTQPALAAARERPNRPGCGQCMCGMCGWAMPEAPASAGLELDEATRDALVDALNDEWHAQAMYRAAIEKFGNVRPFANIVHAEGRHAQHLLVLFDRYDVPAPDNRWVDATFDLPSTLGEACAAAAEAERANVELYERCLESVEPPDIRAMFERLRDVSKNRHLPAFERASVRTS